MDWKNRHKVVKVWSLFRFISRTLSISFTLLLLIWMQGAYADDNRDVVGALFVATNPSPYNEEGQLQYNGILMYHRHRDGTLSLVPGSPFLTQGQGTGPGAFLAEDPLASQDSLIVDKENKFLFVVNAGNNSVSVFRIHPNGLNHVETVPSFGVFPNSLTLRNDILYVLNAAGESNFLAYRVDQKGHLTPCTQCFLLGPLNQWPILPSGQPQATAIPSQIGFTPNGDQLIIVRKEGLTTPNPFGPLAGPGRIDVYKLNPCGLPVDCLHPTSNINHRAPEGRMPFSFIFDKQGNLLVTEIFGIANPEAPLGSGAMTSYKVERNGVLTVISASVPNGGTATCWNARSNKLVYTSNSVSSDISLYDVSEQGALKLLNAQSAIIGESFVDRTLDTTISNDGRFLYILAPAPGAVFAYAINQQDGSLSPIGSASVGQPLSGQVGIALANFPEHWQQCRCEK